MAGGDLIACGINLHTLTPQYHPQSNRQVERFIQSLKSAIKKGMEKAGLNLEEVVTDFWFVHRNANHNTTSISPATLLMNQDLRCHFRSHQTSM